ncbi:MAG: 3-oxoacyl-[acyl-carrier-protein] reductase [Promethearchaeota archaeon]
MAKQKMVAKRPLAGKWALVVGGSKGIGKATAVEFVKLGGSACLVARGADALAAAAEEVKGAKTSEEQFVETISADATEEAALGPLFEELIGRRGVPDYLLNFVGYAYPQYVEKLSLDDFRKNMNVNYYGQLVPTLLVLPHMMRERQGHVLFTSSAMGYLGFMGYATYAPTKFAIVGLAEVLRHELKPHGIKVSVLYPVDTDTPGFEVENESKPKECAMISEVGKLATPEEVAEFTVGRLMKGKFYLLPGRSKLGWRLMRLFPKLVHWFFDGDYAKARKKLGKQ